MVIKMKCNKEELLKYFNAKKFFTYKIATLEITSSSVIDMENEYNGQIGLTDKGYFRWRVEEFNIVSEHTLNMEPYMYKTLEELIKYMDKIIKNILKYDFNVKTEIVYKCGNKKFWNQFAQELR